MPGCYPKVNIEGNEAPEVKPLRIKKAFDVNGRLPTWFPKKQQGYVAIGKR